MLTLLSIFSFLGHTYGTMTRSATFFLIYAASYPRLAKNQSKFQAGKMLVTAVILFIDSSYLIKSEFCDTFICKQSLLK